MNYSELCTAAEQAMINTRDTVQKIEYINSVKPRQITKHEAWPGGAHWDWARPDVNMLILNHAFSATALEAAAPPKTTDDWMHWDVLRTAEALKTWILKQSNNDITIGEKMIITHAINVATEVISRLCDALKVDTVRELNASVQHVTHTCNQCLMSVTRAVNVVAIINHSMISWADKVALDRAHVMSKVSKDWRSHIGAARQRCFEKIDEESGLNCSPWTDIFELTVGSNVLFEPGANDKAWWFDDSANNMMQACASVDEIWCDTPGHMGTVPRRPTIRETLITVDETKHAYGRAPVTAAIWPKATNNKVEPKPGPLCNCNCCIHPCHCVCCRIGEPHISSQAKERYDNVPSHSNESFWQCSACEHHIFKCRKQRDIHQLHCAAGEAEKHLSDGEAQNDQQAVCSASWCNKQPAATCATGCCTHCCKCAPIQPEPPNVAVHKGNKAKYAKATSDQPAQTAEKHFCGPKGIWGKGDHTTDTSISIHTQHTQPKHGEGNSHKARKRRKLRRVRDWKTHCKKVWHELMVPPQSPESEQDAAQLNRTSSTEHDKGGLTIRADQHRGEDLDTIQLATLLEALNKGRPTRSYVERLSSEAPQTKAGSTTRNSKSRMTLLQPDQPNLLRQVNDNVYLGSVQLSKQIQDATLSALCAKAAADMMTPGMPWKQQWQRFGSNLTPMPRLSSVVAWTSQRLFHGTLPGTTRHCLNTGFASEGTIDDLPASAKELAVYVMATLIPEYNLMQSPELILVQINGYRPASMGGHTTKPDEGMSTHVDGLSVDQSKPIVHVKVRMDGTLVLVQHDKVHSKCGKLVNDSQKVTGRQGTVTLMMPYNENYVKHGRTNKMEEGDFAITMVIRQMCPTKGTTAAPEIMSGEIRLTSDNQVTDWTDLSASKIMTCRTIMGRIMFDRSIKKILEKNPGILLRNNDKEFLNPGDIVLNAKASEMLSLEPNVAMGAVMGSQQAGGAVAIYLSPGYVTILNYNIDVGSQVRFIFDAGRHKANTTIMEASIIHGHPVRCLAKATTWPGIHKPCVLYVADAIIERRIPACSSSYWELTFTVSEHAQRVIAHWHQNHNQQNVPHIPRVLTLQTPSCCQHWQIIEGNVGTYRQVENEEWCNILLGGNKRWQQRVAVDLSPGFVGYSVLESYLIKK
jgi:hypothetical protein